MSIHGAGKQEALSTRQINNFLKLCIKCVDFSHSGLLREDGPALIIERIYKKLMPDLNVEDICIDALEKKFIKFIKKEALLSTSPLLTRAFLQVCKQITTNNPHFRENRYGEILSECILEGLRDYFWPALDYQEVPFDDDVPTTFEFEKFDSDYNMNARRFWINNIAFLLASEQEGLAEIIHNTMHLAYLCHGANPGTHTPYIMGKLMAPSLLLRPFGLFAKVLPDEIHGVKKEVMLVGELVSISINDPYFKLPFSNKKSLYEAQQKKGEEAFILSNGKWPKENQTEIQEQRVGSFNPLYGVPCGMEYIRWKNNIARLAVIKTEAEKIKVEERKVNRRVCNLESRTSSSIPLLAPTAILSQLSGINLSDGALLAPRRPASTVPTLFVPSFLSRKDAPLEAPRRSRKWHKRSGKEKTDKSFSAKNGTFEKGGASIESGSPKTKPQKIKSSPKL